MGRHNSFCRVWFAFLVLNASLSSGGRDATMANPLFEGFDDQALNAPRYDEAVFIRIGVSESELAAGYPSDVSALFRYHVVIWEISSAISFLLPNSI